MIGINFDSCQRNISNKIGFIPIELLCNKFKTIFIEPQKNTIGEENTYNKLTHNLAFAT